MRRLSVVAVFSAVALAAQSFEVAAIRPAPEFVASPPADLTGGRFQATLTLKYMIQDAYNVAPYQISGGPEWMAKELWAITAKAEGISGEIPLEQLRPMLKALILDRFQLKVRTGKGVLPYLALRREGSSTKVLPSIAETSDFRIERGPVVTFVKASMASFASWLGPWIPSDRVVLDETGLKGEYDFQLHWTPQPRATVVKDPDAPDLIQPNGPSMFTALKEQLGLRLESKRGPVDVIFVERAERPSDN